MASFNYTVDTTPMAEELYSVSQHVDGTTTAVVAMQAAVLAAEAEAADHICANVNRGFYSLIRSQISQKIARLQSEVDSHITQLKAQSLAVLAIKARMERDYHMISARYLKLFNTLNKNLKSRIIELDRPAIDLAEKNVNRLNNRSRYLTGSVAVNQLETISDSQRIIAANVKKKAEAALFSLQRFLINMKEQEQLSGQFLIKNQLFWDSGQIYFPVAVYHFKSGENSPEDIDIVLPRKGFDPASLSILKNAVFSRTDLDWLHEGIPVEVSREFKLLIASAGRSARVQKTAIQLFEKSIVKA